VILAIETSCDETAAALIDAGGHLRASVVSSQAELHARFGGVVPEVASRRHLELIAPVVQSALDEAKVTLAAGRRSGYAGTRPDRGAARRYLGRQGDRLG